MARQRPQPQNYSNSLKLQKRFYRHIKNKALSLESGHSRAMRTYFKGHQKFLKRPFKLSNASTLFRAVLRSQVIYLGDFHTFDQSSRNLERLIRLMLEEQPNPGEMALGMEMVLHQYQEQVDEFLTGHITEHELLDSINYHDSWRFPWGHYREFFQLAKKHGIKIIALNSQGSLKARDEFAAELIVQELRSEKTRKIFVLFGEAHIFPNRLPHQVVKNYRQQVVNADEFKFTIIHQNIDEVFWKMPQLRGQRNMQLKQRDEIVTYSSNEFCLLTSPPWIKYESMVYWYENISDDPDFDLHSAHFEQGMKKFTENSHETFVYLLEHLWASLLPNQARPSMTDLTDFNLYDASKIDFLTSISPRSGTRHRAVQTYIEASLAKGRPFPLPGSFHYYSPSYSFNRLVLLAGIHIFTYTRGPQLLRHLIEKGPVEERFVYFVAMEMVSYYCSKLINPYRKCDLFQDLKHKSKLRSLPTAKRERFASAIRLLTQGEKSIRKDLLRRRALMLHDLARLIGPLMAEMALAKFQLANEEREQLHELLFRSDLSIKTYLDLRDICCGDTKKLLTSKKRFF